ncbi:ATP-dependent Clp protease adapter ClpS [uncultured Desulfobacter sp.]|jgi:ATP-dependent Clp protease adaptor protein ClpS|uniref:ATP-dependent Clp protease adapter ClpS n=1 Tax=uncultured Desulfobacter sp. TaxID=240139 RepID=UPI0029C6A86C|nr:ATP-dependent Clp protease adapter ClpS [uncultured Desulfobacter sp.]
MTSTDSKTRPGISNEINEDHPPMYKVLLHNDDYTTMDFVVDILIRVFGKSLEKATQIMLNVHNKGKAVCGIYPREIAETKVQTVHNLASGKGFPLKSTMEKE